MSATAKYPTKVIYARVPASLHRKIEAKAKKEGMAMATVVRMLLTQALTKPSGSDSST